MSTAHISAAQSSMWTQLYYLQTGISVVLLQTSDSYMLQQIPLVETRSRAKTTKNTNSHRP